MKWRFVSSLDVRTGGPRWRGRQHRRPGRRRMETLTSRRRDWRMVPTSMEVNLGGAAPSPLYAIRLAAR